MIIFAFESRFHGTDDHPADSVDHFGDRSVLDSCQQCSHGNHLALLDDNFATIVAAVEEGRRIYDNIRKFITYIFASNVPEIMPFVVMAMFHIPLALTVAQMLAIDLGTDLLPALALGTEKPEPTVMSHPPRHRSQAVIDRGLLLRAFGWLGMIESALCFAGFLFVYWKLGGDLGVRVDLQPWEQQVTLPGGIIYILATTIYHAGVVSAQIGNALTSRTESGRVYSLGLLSNRLLLIGIAVEVVLIFAMIYVPLISPWFNHLPLPPVFWLIVVVNGPSLYLADRVRKTVARRLENRRAKRNLSAASPTPV